MKPLSSSPSRTGQAKSVCPAAVDFLHNDGRMASVLPMASRLLSLQKDCQRALPRLFENCVAMRLENDQLTISAPNAATAARLKQTLPSLSDSLNQAGWRINAIRVKIQMAKIQEPPSARPDKTLSRQAISSLAILQEQLASSKNETLKKALGDMVGRHSPAKTAEKRKL